MMRPRWLSGLPTDVFDAASVERMERNTVVLAGPLGLEYLVGADGGVLFVPWDELESGSGAVSVK